MLLGTKEEFITGVALEPLDTGDAVIIFYPNFPETVTEYVSFVKANDDPEEGGQYCHGVVMHDVDTNEFVGVRLATAGTLSVKVAWTGTLLPGTPVYPPVEERGVLSTTSSPYNVIGYYVGEEALTAPAEGYQQVEVLIVRLSAVYIDT